MKEDSALSAVSVEELRAEIVRRECRATLVSAIHAFFCTENHDTGVCNFYTEEQMTKEGSEEFFSDPFPDHAYWNDAMSAMLRIYEVDEAKLLAAFQKVVQAVRMVEAFDPLCYRLFEDLFHYSRKPTSPLPQPPAQ